jgi:acyl-coenzyme A thioesterase PaaI-like protein
MLRRKCAPWLNDLNLVVEDCSVASARLRLPYSPRLARLGGSICGHALMACADAAMAIVISALFGEIRNMASVAHSITFMHPIAIDDVIITATVPTLGSDLVCGDIRCTAAGTDVVAALATSTWALVTPGVRSISRGEQIATARN